MIYEWKKLEKNKNIELFESLEKFKKMFILQNIEMKDDVFVEDFGFHNGYTKEDYISHEYEEYGLKCPKFGLNMDSKFQVFELKNDIYICLGNEGDSAIFESVIKWDKDYQRLKGNGYQFKIEPKTKFIKNLNTNKIEKQRQINISSKEKSINSVYPGNFEEQVFLVNNNLSALFGGSFYSFCYTIEDDKLNYVAKTYLEKIKIVTNENKVYTYEVLLRGEDHPYLQKDAYPILKNDNSFILKNEIFPAILCVVFKDGEKKYIKYPEEKEFKFEKEIVEICLTDKLSYDWIIKM